MWGEHPIARWLPVALAPVAVAYGVAAASVAARDGAAARPAVATAAELAAGWALIGAGLATWWRHPRRATGPLAVLAGFAWFAPDWVGWQLGHGGVRIAALATAGVAAAALAQIALAGRARGVIVLVWALTVAIGVGRALLYDPFADPHCFTYCAGNPLLVDGSKPAAVALDRIDAGLAVFIALATIAAAAARRGRAVALPCVLFACGWAVRAVALAAAPGDDPRRAALVTSFAVRAAAMVALAAALAWALSRARRAAGALRRLVRAQSGSLEATLARGTGDPSLRIAFASADGGPWMDADGLPFAVPRDRALSVIAREGRPIAAVVHDPGGLDTATLEQEIGPAAQLALENERLRAEARAQERELEASRVRIVEAGDAERRRLERDLHDGAQQRLVGLAMALSMARDAFAGDASRARRLQDAGGELQLAIADLRELAHGIHPVELTDEGLAAALETLADRSPVPVALGALPGTRLPERVEIAGYVLVEELLRLAAQRGDGAPVAVAASAGDDTLTIDVEDRGAPSAERMRGELVDVADRVSALRGSLTVVDGAGVRVHAELPCA